MSTRDVTSDAANEDKQTPVAFDKVMLVDVEETPDELKETFVDSLRLPRYKINVSVSSNDLVVSVTHLDGSTPSSTKPLYFKIGDSIRVATAALSLTIVDGTNWFNSGSAELGTLLVPYFVYVVWDSNSSVVALSISRIPWGRLVSDFNATTTNEKHLYNYANFTSTDPVCNIGYFEATLSLSGTSHLWTVPSYTNINLRHEPTLESNWMTWTPAYSASGSLTFTTVSTTFARYKIRPMRMDVELRAAGTLGGSASDTLYATLPFESSLLATGVPMLGAGFTANVAAVVYLNASTPDRVALSKYDLSNYATSGSCTISTVGGYEI